jgi:hypothetical protein
MTLELRRKKWIIRVSKHKAKIWIHSIQESKGEKYYFCPCPYYEDGLCKHIHWCLND